MVIDKWINLKQIEYKKVNQKLKDFVKKLVIV